MRLSTPRTTREPVSICRPASSRKPSSSAAVPWSAADLSLSFFSWRCDLVTASAKRCCSAATASSAIAYSGTSMKPASTTWAVPMATPGETPRPARTRSARRRPRRAGPSRLRSGFIELAPNQFGDGGHRRRRVDAADAHLDLRARAGRQHHQPHDRAAGDADVALDHRDLGLELADQLHELGGGAGMQAALVADFEGAADGAGWRGVIGGHSAIDVRGMHSGSASFDKLRMRANLRGT